MSVAFYIWLVRNKTALFCWHLCVFPMAIGLLLSVIIVLFSGCWVLGEFVPDSRIWIVPQKPPPKMEKKDGPVNIVAYTGLRGLMIILMTIAYSSVLVFCCTPLIVGLRQNLEKYRKEYEEERSVKQVHETNDENLTYAPLIRV